jgi:hypothetical protein
LITSSFPVANPANTTTMISAADVMIRPDRCRPITTALSLLSPSRRNSAIRESRNTS